jgi:hypothetical protein
VEAIEKAIDDVGKFDAGEWIVLSSLAFIVIIYTCSCVMLTLEIVVIVVIVTDDWFVIAISDANFERYGISANDLRRVMTRNPKVHTALICIGEGAEASWYVYTGIRENVLTYLTTCPTTTGSRRHFRGEHFAWRTRTTFLKCCEASYPHWWISDLNR